MMEYRYEFTDAEITRAVPKLDLSNEALRFSIERLNAETERWIWKAMAQGIGNRVWRSNPLPEPWPSTVTRYQFAIVAPGESPPGAGMFFGPFSNT